MKRSNLDEESLQQTLIFMAVILVTSFGILLAMLLL